MKRLPLVAALCFTFFASTSPLNSPELNFLLPPTDFRGPVLREGDGNPLERCKRSTDSRKTVFGNAPP
jgi:hypothetical protein